MTLPGGEARFVVAASAALLFAGMALAAYLLVAAYADAQRPLAAIEARYARLTGLKAVRPQLDAGVAEIEKSLARHTYPATTGTDRIGTDLQQRVRRVAESSGVSVTGSQILPVRAAAGFSQIPVAVTVEGGLEGLRNMLLALREETPSVQVDSIILQSRARRRARGAPEEQLLTAQMNLSVLQVQP